MEKWVIRPENKRFSWQSIGYILLQKRADCSCLRPLPFMAGAAALGVLAAGIMPWLGLLALPLLLLVWLCRVRLRISPAWLSFALPIIFASSALHTVLILLPAQAQADNLAGTAFELQGRVMTLSEADQPAGRVFIQQDNGIMLSLIYSGAGRDLPFGSRIAIAVRGSRPDGRRNPGGFDERAWLASQGIFLEAWPIKGALIDVLSPPPAFSLFTAGAAIRDSLISVFNRLLDPEQSALLAGLVVGDTSKIDDQTRSDFRRSGLAHLMSVSGANVSFLLLPASRLLKKSRVGRKSRLWLLLVFLIAFGFVTGWQIPVTRAILMAGCILFGRLLKRPNDSISALSAAALLILLTWPMSALSLGFWLSLAATASLVLFAEPLAEQIRARMPVLPEAVAMTLAAAICVQIVLLPLLAQMNQEISLVGLLANLPAGPLVAILTVMTALLFPVALIVQPMLGDSQNWILPTLGKPLALGIDLLRGIAETAGRVQIGRLASSILNIAFWLAWMLFVATWFWRTFGHQSSNYLPARLLRQMRWPMTGAWLVIALLLWIGQPQIQVWFLDVGQGDAILIIAKSGESILIDGGSPGNGHQVLMPALDALGIARLDLAISTHGHADHAGGLLELIEAGRINELLLSADEARAALTGLTPTASDLTAELLKSANDSGIRVSEVSGHDTITLGPQIGFDVLNLPNRQTTITEINDYSLLLLAKLADQTLLLAADCSQTIEEELTAERKWPPAEILKVSHHGSRFSTSSAFLDSVQPTAAIISVGPNQYGHPAQATLTRLQSTNCQVFRTDRRGALLLSIWPTNWTLDYGY